MAVKKYSKETTKKPHRETKREKHGKKPAKKK